MNKEQATVLFVIGSLDIGGTERHLVQVLPHLMAKGFQPIVCALTHRGSLADALESSGVELIAPPWDGVFGKSPRKAIRYIMLPFSALFLLWVLWVKRPDIVHHFLPMPYLVGGLVGLFAPKKKRVMSRRSLNHYQRAHGAFVAMERWLHVQMDAVLGNSRAVVRQLHEENVPAETLCLIYNGIETDTIDHAPDRETTREAMSIDKNALVLILVANLIPYKGHADLIAALGQIATQLPNDWVLLCAGKDNDIQADLVALSHRHGIADHIRWLGLRSDVGALLKASDIGFLVSHEEGFSNAILEGMAAGLPMVVTDVGGNAEAVVDGETGIVVPAHDPSALGRAILVLAENAELGRDYGRCGRARIGQRFTLERCVSDYAALYAALLDEGKIPDDLRARLG